MSLTIKPLDGWTISTLMVSASVGVGRGVCVSVGISVSVGVFVGIGVDEGVDDAVFGRVGGGGAVVFVGCGV